MLPSASAAVLVLVSLLLFLAVVESGTVYLAHTWGNELAWDAIITVCDAVGVVLRGLYTELLVSLG